MNDKEILPIGTVVSLNRLDDIKVMIVSRFATLTIEKKKYYFEYLGCQFPTGLVEDAVLNFNSEDINEIFYKGYIDAEELAKQQVIKKWLEETDAEKADTQFMASLAKDLIKQEQANSQSQEPPS